MVLKVVVLLVMMAFSSCSTADRIQKCFDDSNGTYGWWGRIDEIVVHSRTNDVTMKIWVYDSKYHELLNKASVSEVNTHFFASAYMDSHFLSAVRLVAENKGNITLIYQCDNNNDVLINTIQNHYLQEGVMRGLTPNEVDNNLLYAECLISNQQCPMFLNTTMSWLSVNYETNSVVYRYKVMDKVYSFWAPPADVDFTSIFSSIEQNTRGQMRTFYKSDPIFQNMIDALIRVNGSLVYEYILYSSGAKKSFSITSEELKRLI